MVTRFFGPISGDRSIKKDPIVMVVIHGKICDWLD
jgi:hypothetical protein